jgi:hypothetical protein
MNERTCERRLCGLVALMVLMPWFSGCTNVPGGGNPPEIPPASTLVMDFDDFTESGEPKPSGIEVRADGDPFMRQNWGWAVTHVAVWNTVITVGLAVPVIAFLESFNHEPERQEDGTWVWAYDVEVVGVPHHAELHAQTVDGDIHWAMFITKEGFYEDFNWFTGVSNLPATEGTWTLFREPDDPSPLIDIDWHRNPVEETADIKYTNVVPDGPENGGFIFYGVTQETPFDAFYEIFNKGQDNTTKIEWNRESKEGRVRDPRHFGDDEWRCWDDELKDVACS